VPEGAPTVTACHALIPIAWDRALRCAPQSSLSARIQTAPEQRISGDTLRPAPVEGAELAGSVEPADSGRPAGIPEMVNSPSFQDGSAIVPAVARAKGCQAPGFAGRTDRRMAESFFAPHGWRRLDRGDYADDPVSGGLLFDGTGAPPAAGEVVVEDGRIVDVGLGLDGDETVDLKGHSLLQVCSTVTCISPSAATSIQSPGRCVPFR
jgi:hypothetical protein